MIHFPSRMLSFGFFFFVRSSMAGIMDPVFSLLCQSCGRSGAVSSRRFFEFMVQREILKECIFSYNVNMKPLKFGHDEPLPIGEFNKMPAPERPATCWPHRLIAGFAPVRTVRILHNCIVYHSHINTVKLILHFDHFTTELSHSRIRVSALKQDPAPATCHRAPPRRMGRSSSTGVSNQKQMKLRIPEYHGIEIAQRIFAL